jgi:PKD repeat protein
MKLSLKIAMQLFTALFLASSGVLWGIPATAHAQPHNAPLPTGAQDIPGLADGYTSADGRFTVFDSDKYTLLPGESYTSPNVFVYERASGKITRISLNADGTYLSTYPIGYSAISHDGRYVLYTVNYSAFYLHDRDTDQNGQYDETGKISNTPLAMVVEGIPQDPKTCAVGAAIGGEISSDNIYVMFPGCYGGTGQYDGKMGIFIYNIVTGQTIRITDGMFPHMSTNGRYIAYSDYVTLPNGDGQTELYRWDRDSDADGIFDEAAPTPELASVNSVGEPADLGIEQYIHNQITADGRFVAFTSNSTNLYPGAASGVQQIFIHDFQSGDTTLVSLSNDDLPLNEQADVIDLSDDGRFVSFTSDSDAAASWDDNHATDVFLRDTLLGTTTIVTGKADHNLNIYLQERPAKELAIFGPAQGGLDREYSFTATLSSKSGGLPTSYTWQVTDQSDLVHTVTSANDQVTLQWSTPGDKTVQVTANTTDGPVSAAQTFTVYAPPVANFQAEVTGPDQYGVYSVNFTNTSTGQYTSSNWDDGGAWQSSDPTAMLYQAAGAYTVSLTVSNPGGSNTATKVIEIGGSNPLPRAYPFTSLGSLGLPDGSYTWSDWGDFDQDGDLDLLVSGCFKLSDEWWAGGGCEQTFTRIYENKEGVFEDLHAGLKVVDGYVGWVDLDRDGLLDVATLGPNSYSYPEIALYRNLGNGHFSRISTTGLPWPEDVNPITWVDYDQDGDPDALIDHKLYQNYDGVFQDTQITFSRYTEASDWGDFDQDGDLDLLAINGPGNSSTPKTHLYRNDGGAFTEINAGLPDFNGNLVSWVDFDQDGDLDVLMGSNAATHLYRNDSGSFSEVQVSLPVVSHESVAAKAQWADYDHDGDLDLLVDNHLFQATAGTLVPTELGSGYDVQANYWMDFNGDGLLDITMTTGEEGWGSIYGWIAFYRNNSQSINGSPTTPQGLTSDISGNTVTLSWSPAADDQTPPDALTYNLRLSTTPGGTQALYPNPSDQPGSHGEGSSAILRNLPSGKTYYWSVQAVDAGLAASAFSEEKSFTIPAAPITAVTVSGETLGFPATEYTFTAALTPQNAQLPVTYTWQATGQTPVTHPASHLPNDTASFTWDVSGNYSVHVTADNGLGQPVSTDYPVVISTIPRPDFHSSTVGTAPANITFYNDTTGDADTWEWNFGDDQTSTDQAPTHTYAAPGVYTVSLKATGPEGFQSLTKTDYIHIYQAVTPSFSVSPTTSGTAPLALDFTNTSTGDVASVRWDFGDGTTSTENNPSHTFTTSGNYEVELYVTGFGGDTRDNYTNINVKSASQAAFDLDVTTGVAPLTVHFTNQSTGDFTSSYWTFENGVSSTETNPSYTFTSAGSFTIWLRVDGPTGSSYISKDIHVYRPVHAGIYIYSPTTGTAPYSITFYNANYDDVASLLWDFGDGTTSTSMFPFHVFNAPGVYPVTLTLTGQGGDIATDTLEITVTSPTDPYTAAFHADAFSGMPPLTVHFTNDTTGNFTSSAWDFGDGATSTETSPTHTYTQPGTFTVNLTVNGLGGTATSTLTDYIQVFGPNHVLAAAFHADLLTGPSPLTVHFTDDSTGSPITWLWEFGDGIASADPNPVHTYTQPGDYTVTLTVTGPGGLDRKARTNYIHVGPDSGNHVYLPLLKR